MDEVQVRNNNKVFNFSSFWNYIFLSFEMQQELLVLRSWCLLFFKTTIPIWK